MSENAVGQVHVKTYATYHEMGVGQFASLGTSWAVPAHLSARDLV